MLVGTQSCVPTDYPCFRLLAEMANPKELDKFSSLAGSQLNMAGIALATVVSESIGKVCGKSQTGDALSGGKDALGVEKRGKNRCLRRYRLKEAFVTLGGAPDWESGAQSANRIKHITPWHG